MLCNLVLLLPTHSTVYTICIYRAVGVIHSIFMCPEMTCLVEVCTPQGRFFVVVIITIMYL